MLPGMAAPLPGCVAPAANGVNVSISVQLTIMMIKKAILLLRTVFVLTVKKLIPSSYQTKRPQKRSFIHCAYAWQPLVDELRNFESLIYNDS